MALIIAGALAIINLWAFAQFGIDKQRASRGERRISEADLLRPAWLGGFFGAYAGRAWFRHKTRKASFSIRLHGIALFQLAIAGAIAWQFWQPG